jgi:hypothetical protein
MGLLLWVELSLGLRPAFFALSLGQIYRHRVIRVMIKG